MGKSKFLLKGGSIVAASSAALSSLAAQNVNAVNWEYVFSFFPWFQDYILSFFSEDCAKSIVACNLSEKLKKAVEEVFSELEWKCRDYNNRPAGGWWAQYWGLGGGEIFSSFKNEEGGFSFDTKVTHDLYSKNAAPVCFNFNFCCRKCDICNLKLDVKDETNINDVKQKLNSLNRNREDIESLVDLYYSKTWGFTLHNTTDNKAELTVEWPNNFKPKVKLGDQEYEFNKLSYDAFTSQINLYDEFGNLCLNGRKLEEGELKKICESIQRQKKDFDKDLLEKGYNILKEKYPNIELKINSDERELEGTFEVEKVKIPIKLLIKKGGFCDDFAIEEKRSEEIRKELENTYVCSLYVGDYSLVAFECSDEKSVEAIEKLDVHEKSLLFFLNKVKELKKASIIDNDEKVEVSENGIIKLKTKNGGFDLGDYTVEEWCFDFVYSQGGFKYKKLKKTKGQVGNSFYLDQEKEEGGSKGKKEFDEFVKKCIEFKNDSDVKDSSENNKGKSLVL